MFFSVVGANWNLFLHQQNSETDQHFEKRHEFRSDKLFLIPSGASALVGPLP